jgi:hypothetical protein
MSVSGNINTASALSAQIQSSALSRTLSGIVRSELPTIEDALRHGLRYEQLCQHLAALGVTVSPGTLRQTVYRLRRQQSGRGDDPRPLAPQPVPDTVPVPQSAAALTLPHPPLLKAPLRPAPIRDGPAVSDTVPLLEVKPALSAGAEPSTDFITAIRQSCPDLDVLAYRYRQSQRHEPSSGSQVLNTSSIKPATTADPTSLSPGSASS